MRSSRATDFKENMCEVSDGDFYYTFIITLEAAQS